MVKFGEKLLLATVGHTLVDCDRAEVSGRFGKDMRSFYAEITACRCLGPGKLDVGILEVPQEMSGQIEDYIERNDIVTDSPLTDGQQLMVVGFPDSRHVSASPSTDLAVCNTLYAEISPHEKWSEYPSQPEPDAGHSFLLSYPSDGTRVVTGIHGPVSGEIAAEYPKPTGVSGGGIWLPNMDVSPGDLHSPRAKLVGLQAAWFEQSRLLRCIFIREWLQLVVETYPNTALRC
jgi:hypothetical protein